MYREHSRLNCRKMFPKFVENQTVFFLEYYGVCKIVYCTKSQSGGIYEHSHQKSIVIMIRKRIVKAVLVFYSKALVYSISIHPVK